MTQPLIGIGSDVVQKQGERDRTFVSTTYDWDRDIRALLLRAHL
jgi:hypothetical protein